MPAYTWATGETITAAKLNTLETEAWRVANQIAEGNSTARSSTSSTSFVDAAATVTFTAKTTSVYIQICGGSSYASSTSIYAVVGVNINSVDYALTDCDSIGSYAGGVLVTGLTAGVSYTAKTRLRASGAATAYINDNSVRQTIVVFEISK